MYLFNKPYIKFVLILFTIISLDQFSKLLINDNYFFNKDFIIFSFKYIRNYGAAFNIFSGNRIFLSLISILSSIILIYFIFFKENINLLNKYGLSFILAGSLGNGIDRIIKGYVIDFINIEIFDFPIFNIADISINIGCFILIFNYFKYKK
tara:strand:+ start:86 stop:538 length:453 start_codon:yes stop_codon:yes gene_type:complete